MTKIKTQNQKETVALGTKLAKELKAGDIICLFGDLGSGKTTLVKGLGKGLKVSPSKVISPTFVLMNIYEGTFPIFHFDLYRLEKMQEIGMIGYDEFLYGDGIAVVEWAERLGTLLPKEYIEIKLTHEGQDKRLIEVTAHGARYRGRFKKI